MTASKNRLTFSKQKHIEFWVRIVYFGNPGRMQRVPLKIKILFEQNMWTFSKRLWKDLSVIQDKQNHWYKTLKVKLFIKWMQEKYFYWKEINRGQFQSYCIEFNYASESDSPVVFFYGIWQHTGVGKERAYSDFISQLRSTLCYCVEFW